MKFAFFKSVFFFLFYSLIQYVTYIFKAVVLSLHLASHII